MSEIKCSYTRLAEIDSLVPNPRNTNKHPTDQIMALSKIISARGFRHPIIVSKRSGFIIAGHGRLEAAKMLGLKQVPIDEQIFENEADEYMFLEADNQIAKYAEFDESKMMDNLKELNIDLQTFDFGDLGLLDFNFNIEPEKPIKEEKSKDGEQKYCLQIEFPNDMEMMDIHDDLLSRGYIVKVM